MHTGKCGLRSICQARIISCSKHAGHCSAATTYLFLLTLLGEIRHCVPGRTCLSAVRVHPYRSGEWVSRQSRVRWHFHSMPRFRLLFVPWLKFRAVAIVTLRSCELQPWCPKIGHFQVRMFVPGFHRTARDFHTETQPRTNGRIAGCSYSSMSVIIFKTWSMLWHI